MSAQSEPESEGLGVAFLFPGQGSQVVGMGREVYDRSPAARAIFQQVDDALQRPLSRLVFAGPEDELRRTINAQPAIMAVSLACVGAMKETLGVGEMPRPMMLAGHSLGEYTALAAAGVLDVGDTARLVQRRGELMQEACDLRPGAMAAIIGLDPLTVEEIARETNTYVSNVNTHEQIVISGERMNVARALDLATSRGAKKAVPLKVSGAFHSVLMEPAQAALMDALSALKFKDPSVPIIANCTAEPLATAEAVQSELVSQIVGCVQWKRSIDYMVGSGINRFVEVGPGTTLSGLVKRIASAADVTSVGDMESILRLRKN